jgi:malate dehydrogenase (oxaloacetate-decarboxylating)
LCIHTKDVDDRRLRHSGGPDLGGINLEDISAPRCFEIERRLRAQLDIPVFHDDQHGTAIVVLAALLNALRIVGKQPEDVTVVAVGAGAAGVACTEIMLAQGVGDATVCNRHGTSMPARSTSMPSARRSPSTPTSAGCGARPTRRWPAPTCCSAFRAGRRVGHRGSRDGRRCDRLRDGQSGAGGQPEEVRDGVAIMAPGRSDYPNQINNVLAFPGVFKGALEVRARTINEEMKHAIARVIPDDELHADHIIPSIFNRRVAESVAEAVANAAGSVALSTAHARRHRAERWRGSSNRPAGSARSAWTACPSASSAGSPTHAPAERASRPPLCGPM